MRRIHASTSRTPAPSPTAVRGVPDPAEWVPEEGRERWYAVSAELHRLNLLAKSLHVDFATLYADTYAKWAAAARLVNADPDDGGGLLVSGFRDADRKHPAMQLYREMSTQLMALQGQAGLTPNALARMKAVDDGANEDPASRVLS